MKNIYNTGAFQLEKQDFKLNIFYKESSELNFKPKLKHKFLIQLLVVVLSMMYFYLFLILTGNFNNDPQISGDGFFDFVSNITVIETTGQIILQRLNLLGSIYLRRLTKF